jgi:UDPglucose 6-dehydrogenase
MSSRNLGLIGAGKLGLSLALILEEAGHTVYCFDKNKTQSELIRNKQLNTVEPHIEDMLSKSKNLNVVDTLTDIYKLAVNFVVVLTPSLENGSYDHSSIDSVVEELLSENEKAPDFSEKLLVIVCTTMPKYCMTVQERLKKYNYKVLYSPEFIAQGTIVQGMKNPDMVLIGGEDTGAMETLKNIYASYVGNTPQYSLMTLTEAEICKISLNCFLTTKISFANTIGDIVVKAGGDPSRVLDAVGADSRIGKKFLRWGHGYGGPCLPRDNRAISYFADSIGIENKIGLATDEINNCHLDRLVEYVVKRNVNNKAFFFDGVVYKKNTTILEESQQLELAKRLAQKNYQVLIHDTPYILKTLEEQFGPLFKYVSALSGTEEEDHFYLNAYIK